MTSRALFTSYRFPRFFGRGRRYLLDAPVVAKVRALNADVQLFATTFLGGLLFMTVYLG